MIDKKPLRVRYPSNSLKRKLVKKIFYHSRPFDGENDYYKNTYYLIKINSKGKKRKEI